MSRTAALADRRAGRAIDVDEVKAIANAAIESLAPELLPNGRREHGYWRTGSIADDPGQSLAVTLQGADRGMWCDYAAPQGHPGSGGNVIQLVAQVKFGGDFRSAFAWLKSRLGLDHLDPRRLATVKAEAAEESRKAAQAATDEAEQKRRRAKGLYLSARPIADTPAEAYLKGRALDLRPLGHFPGALAFHGEVWNVEAQRKLPCLLAAVVDLEGRHIATHRTWIAPDGRGGWAKANLATPKMALGSIAGGFIPLWKGACRKSMGDIDEGTDVYVTEGIEDGLSVVLAKPQARVIAGVWLSNIGAVRLPPQIGRLIVVGQRDTNPKTLQALERAIGRQQEAGHDVYLTPPPAGGFKDVNEALMADPSTGSGQVLGAAA